MSIPKTIQFTEGKYSRERVELFNNAARDANRFNNKQIFSTNNIQIENSIKEKDKLEKKNNLDYTRLPRYVKNHWVVLTI